MSTFNLRGINIIDLDFFAERAEELGVSSDKTLILSSVSRAKGGNSRLLATGCLVLLFFFFLSLTKKQVSQQPSLRQLYFQRA